MVAAQLRFHFMAAFPPDLTELGQPYSLNFRPLFLEIDPQNRRLFVLTTNSRLEMRRMDNPTSEPLCSIGSVGSEPLQFSNPGQMVMFTHQSQLMLCIADSGNNRVQIIRIEETEFVFVSSLGKPRGVEGWLNQPTAVAVKDDNPQDILVCVASEKNPKHVIGALPYGFTPGPNPIFIFDLTGQLHYHFDFDSSIITSMCFRASYLYLAETSPTKLSIIDLSVIDTPQLLSQKMLSCSTAHYEDIQPFTIDDRELIIACSVSPHIELHIFDNRGHFLYVIRDSRFIFPHCARFDQINGHVWVADTNARLILKISSPELQQPELDRPIKVADLPSFPGLTIEKVEDQIGRDLQNHPARFRFRFDPEEIDFDPSSYGTAFLFALGDVMLGSIEVPVLDISFSEETTHQFSSESLNGLIMQVRQCPFRNPMHPHLFEDKISFEGKDFYSHHVSDLLFPNILLAHFSCDTRLDFQLSLHFGSYATTGSPDFSSVVIRPEFHLLRTCSNSPSSECCSQFCVQSDGSTLGVETCITCGQVRSILDGDFSFQFTSLNLDPLQLLHQSLGILYEQISTSALPLPPTLPHQCGLPGRMRHSCETHARSNSQPQHVTIGRCSQCDQQDARIDPSVTLLPFCFNCAVELIRPSDSTLCEAILKHNLYPLVAILYRCADYYQDTTTRRRIGLFLHFGVHPFQCDKVMAAKYLQTSLEGDPFYTFLNEQSNLPPKYSTISLIQHPQ